MSAIKPMSKEEADARLPGAADMAHWVARNFELLAPLRNKKPIYGTSFTSEAVAFLIRNAILHPNFDPEAYVQGKMVGQHDLSASIFYIQDLFATCFAKLPVLQHVLGMRSIDHNFGYNYSLGHIITGKYSPDIPWRVRESHLIKAKVKATPPWSNDLPPVPDHFAHMSSKEEGMISFTPDDAKGKAGRHTRMKPGRYLTKFYPDLDPVMVEKWQAQLAKIGQVEIITDGKAIAKMYMSFADTGLKSCMTKSMKAYPYGHVHPTSIYGGSDLALAIILGANGSPSARAIVWPEKKRWYRAYGDIPKMTVALDRLGYKPGTFDGARLPMVFSTLEGKENILVTPYIDGHLVWADEEAKQLVLITSGLTPPNGARAFQTSQHGYVAYAGKDPRARRQCFCCGETGDLIPFVPITDGASPYICEGCSDDYYNCENCETSCEAPQRVWDEDHDAVLQECQYCSTRVNMSRGYDPYGEVLLYPSNADVSCFIPARGSGGAARGLPTRYLRALVRDGDNIEEINGTFHERTTE